jgi:acetyl esterase/lipase
MASESAAAPQTLTYATHDGVALAGELYVPAGAGPFPVMVLVHGGGWVQGARGALAHWGRHMAAHGIAGFTVSYRFATKDKKTFPQAAQDVIAAVQFVRGKAAALKLDPQRVGLLGVSAGAHLSALTALAGGQAPLKGGYPQDEFANESAAVKVLVGVYGVYDLRDMWQQFNVGSPTENNVERHLGCSPMQDPRPYFGASPINHATFANHKVAVYLSCGTEDDLVDRRTQTDAFQLALKQANFFVRNCVVQGAGHYWMNDPIDESNSYSGVLAPKLMRFLKERL